MTQMFLAPTGPMEHVDLTLLNPVPASKFRKFLGEDQYRELKERYPQEEYRTWGWEPSQEKLWRKLRSGDYVFFVSGEGHVFIVKVVYKFHNKEFAQDCWNVNPKTGNTWEYMFVLEDDLKVLSVDKSEFVQAFGYKENYKLQGSIRVTDDHVSEMLRSYGSVRGLIDHFSEFVETAEEYEDSVEEKKVGTELGSLSRKEKVEILRERLETSYQREPGYVEYNHKRIKRNAWLAELIKEKNDYKCQYCGFTFEKKDGTRYVEAAHIKPLASSKMDTEENMLALCPNHHKMLDHGTEEERGKILERCLRAPNEGGAK